MILFFVVLSIIRRVDIILSMVWKGHKHKRTLTIHIKFFVVRAWFYFLSEKSSKE